MTTCHRPANVHRVLGGTDRCVFEDCGRVTERKLQLGEVDTIDADTIGGMKRSLAIEDTARDQCINVGMEVEEAPEGLRGCEKDRDRSVDISRISRWRQPWDS